MFSFGEHVTSKTAELEPNFQKYKGRFVFCGSVFKDNSGVSAVFYRTRLVCVPDDAAKMMDVIARLPGCDGQSVDAVSAYIQVKCEDAPRVVKNSQVRMSRRMDTLQDTFGQKRGKTLKIQRYLLNENYVATHQLDCHGSDNSKKLY